ncbi:MAG TPA: flagellar hook protein FlgE [Acidisphaera sp.]|nr:flagellar hook protein FlgE [Acidisphaera sp.]HME20036.1 flagellar hook protein FlgE [Acetobacteraceae bacterium]
MSLFGAMATAIGGLTAQSSNFTNISDNIANSQTVGYKRVQTDFTNYLSTSTPTDNGSDSVVGTPSYVNNVQGTVTQSNNPLAMAISGQGFFSVSQPNGSQNGQTTFSGTQYYTQAGDWQLNANGYLVNSAGYYLNGWAVNPATGAVNQSTIAPIQVSESSDPPQATGTVTLAANPPATPATAGPITSQVQVYDAQGTSHAITLNWTQTAPGQWSVQVVSPDNTNGTTDLGTANVTFGGALGAGTAPAGTPSALAVSGADPGTIAVSAATAASPATITFTAQFNNGPQQISLNIGNYGQANGVTQFAGTQYSLESLTQNGQAPGSFSSVTTTSNGNVVVNYSNGNSQTIAQVPIVTFAAPDQLQSQNGQAFTQSPASGNPLVNSAGSGSAGTLLTGSLEGSNVDLATELSNLIVAQQAYSASAKVVTTADQMLQTTVNMKQ